MIRELAQQLLDELDRKGNDSTDFEHELAAVSRVF
jgi:hypothetical protein